MPEESETCVVILEGSGKTRGRYKGLIYKEEFPSFAHYLRWAKSSKCPDKILAINATPETAKTLLDSTNGHVFADMCVESATVNSRFGKVVDTFVLAHEINKIQWRIDEIEDWRMQLDVHMDFACRIAEHGFVIEEVLAVWNNN